MVGCKHRCNFIVTMTMFLFFFFISSLVYAENGESPSVHAEGAAAETAYAINEATAVMDGNDIIETIQRAFAAIEVVQNALNDIKKAVQGTRVYSNDGTISTFFTPFILAIISIPFFLLGLAGFILSLISLRKIRAAVKKLEKMENEQKNKLEEQERKRNEQYSFLDSRLDENRSTTDNNIKDLHLDLESVKSTVSSLEDSVNKFDCRIEKITEDMRVCNNSQDVQYDASSKDPIELFNSWAKNPQLPLPPEFYFISGDPKERFEAINLLSSISDEPKKWIANQTGNGQSKQYLFYNPNFINEGTDITPLYTIENSTKLQAMRKNKIRIIGACEIKNDQIVSCGVLEVLA